MRLLLDTNVFLWAVREPAKLSPRVMGLLTSLDNELIVPAMVPWELAIKFRTGKLPEAELIVVNYAAVLLRLGATSLSVEHAHTLCAGLLDWGHRDPFDRLLAAIAVIEGLPILSKDSVFDERPDIRRIW
ncbi:MAG: type II toxin-antitoxin system VapC family toxin [Propionibacteriaceae bacterium]|jgi:PIN domain nuclease of toxin-antitoxin system|nr:type II toxin-antitoxin system VapC family toxin [Propionibacteriaceae bacterium]